MEDGNKKHYFVKLKDSEIVDTFMALSLENAPVKVWKKGQKEEQAEEYLIKGFNSERRYLVLKSPPRLLGFIALKKTKKNCFFRLGGQGLLTFTTGDILWEEGECRLYLKDPAFRCQKRINYRLAADSFNKISFGVDGETLGAFDLSANGVGIVITRDEEKRFAKGRQFKNCKVFLNDKSYDIPLVSVASIWEERTALFKATGNLEVGIKFEEFDHADEEKLSQEIHSLAREVEVRKTLVRKTKS